MRCSDCPYSFGGSPSNMSDICYDCRHDPDTGWGGFTDGATGRHYNSDEEYEREQEIGGIFDDWDEEEEW